MRQHSRPLKVNKNCKLKKNISNPNVHKTIESIFVSEINHLHFFFTKYGKRITDCSPETQILFMNSVFFNPVLKHHEFSMNQ